MWMQAHHPTALTLSLSKGPRRAPKCAEVEEVNRPPYPANCPPSTVNSAPVTFRA
jgi:hypothetical protein